MRQYKIRIACFVLTLLRQSQHIQVCCSCVAVRACVLGLLSDFISASTLQIYGAYLIIANKIFIIEKNKNQISAFGVYSAFSG